MGLNKYARTTFKCTMRRSSGRGVRHGGLNLLPHVRSFLALLLLPTPACGPSRIRASRWAQLPHDACFLSRGPGAHLVFDSPPLSIQPIFCRQESVASQALRALELNLIPFK